MNIDIKLLLLLYYSFFLFSQGEGSHIDAEDLEKVKLDKKGYEKVKTIHMNWYIHSMKALIAQLSKNLLPKLDRNIKENLLGCFSRIYDKKDLVESSKCLLEAKQHYELVKLRRRGLRRRKQLKAIRLFPQFWRQRRAKRSLKRLVIDTVSKSDSHGYFVKNMDYMPKLKTAKEVRSPVQKVTNLIMSLTNKRKETNNGGSWIDTYKALLTLKKKMNRKEKESGARVYNQRMYDLVLDLPVKKSVELEVFDKVKMSGIMRSAFDLMSSIEGSAKNGGSSNFKFLSPRFASIMPDKNENRGKLSPSILSFYNDDSEDQILPIPKLMESAGLGGKDRDSVIELAMELSGAKGIVDEALKILKSVDLPELDVAVTEHAKKSMTMVDEIKKSYNGRQKKELDNKGFTLIEPHQMRKLMAEQGIAHRRDIFNVDEYESMTRVQRKNMVWDMVRQIAYGGNHTIRRKRQNFGPHFLSPTVLSPVLFTPIYGLNVLGPTVLSPGLFTPLILNPSVLSPYVFSPTVGIPFIVSPYVLSPYVFSPLVMAPFILTPYVISPNVFNPYVLSPLILSPLVICPDVVSPMTLGGAILSPGVLSPSVLSKSYLMASVLSPSFLS
ncbi:unnamed protein product [Caenorhabditis bovis]|uniref:Uncharacterized protein n=1 Tax=Caenorhabditis bovis TaxID=2654633 RepID=A0A8S1F0N1_9PELO|nr:unnamed protein product [Caenorhabditis bovis]